MAMHHRCSGVAQHLVLLLLLCTASQQHALMSSMHPRGPVASARQQRCGVPVLQQTSGSGPLSDVQSLWSRLMGTVDEDEEERQMTVRTTPPDDADTEFVPLILVVGARGRLGRIIVRKLVLRGFRVAVLVRSLSSDTLNVLGSGVSYSYGDMTDYRSLLDAMEVRKAKRTSLVHVEKWSSPPRPPYPDASRTSTK